MSAALSRQPVAADEIPVRFADSIVVNLQLARQRAHTRQPLAYAAWLRRHDYGVVMMDARDQGESEGAVATYGWKERHGTQSVVNVNPSAFIPMIASREHASTQTNAAMDAVRHFTCSGASKAERGAWQLLVPVSLFCVPHLDEDARRRHLSSGAL